jgi:hypothetical protein
VPVGEIEGHEKRRVGVNGGRNGCGGRQGRLSSGRVLQ